MRRVGYDSRSAALAGGQARKPATIAELVTYRGADREAILYAGAKTEGKIIWCTSLAGDCTKSSSKRSRPNIRILWDARQEVSYPSMSIVTRRKHTVDDCASVMRMVKAHVEGIHLLKTNKELAMKVLSKYLKTNDRELLEGSYEIYRKDFISVPYPITQGLQPTYEYVAQQRPDVWNHKPEAFMDASFIIELEKTGFIKNLSSSTR